MTVVTKKNETRTAGCCPSSTERSDHILEKLFFQNSFIFFARAVMKENKKL